MALAAPTGKAAARLQEAVRGAADPSWTRPEAEAQAWLGGLTASTAAPAARLRRGGEQRHGRVVLPHDVVVVDEASMLSLPLVARLLAALRPGARLLLVGDPDQLASVEAGAVLADLVAPARDGGRTRRVAQRLAEVAPHDPAPPVLAGTPTAAVRGGVALLRSGAPVRRCGAPSWPTPCAAATPAARYAVLTRGDPAVRFLPLDDDAARDRRRSATRCASRCSARCAASSPRRGRATPPARSARSPATGCSAPTGAARAGWRTGSSRSRRGRSRSSTSRRAPTAAGSACRCSSPPTTPTPG